MGALAGVCIGGRCRTVRAVTMRRGSAGRHAVEQGGDVGLDAFEGLSGQGAAFHGEHAAVGDGGLLGAAADQGGVQVAGAEEGMRPGAQLLVELAKATRWGRRPGWRRRRGAGVIRGRRRR